MQVAGNSESSAARVVCTLVLVAAWLWVVAIAGFWVFESTLVYGAHWSRDTHPGVAATPFEFVSLRSKDGVDLEAGVLWMDVDPADRYWIVFCSPSGGSFYTRRLARELERLHGFGYNIVAFNYRGFGRNQGVPSEKGLYEDAMAAYRFVTLERGIPPSRVILAGCSLGAAVAVEVAARVPTAGLLLVSPIDSVPLVAVRICPWAPVHSLASVKFDAISKVERIAQPVVMLRGSEDALMPTAAARAFFTRLQGPKLLLEIPRGHNLAAFTDATGMREAMTKFWPAPAPPAAKGSD